MKYVFHMIFLLLFSAIQTTWIEGAEIFGAKVNLLLTYIIVMSCFCEKKEGLTVSLIFGLVLDLIVGRIIGINAVLMMILSYFIMTFCEKVIRKNTFGIIFLITLISTFLYELFYYIIAFLGNLEFGAVFLKVLLPETLAGVIAAIPIYLILKWASRFLWQNKGDSIG